MRGLKKEESEEIIETMTVKDIKGRGRKGRNRQKEKGIKGKKR